MLTIGAIHSGATSLAPVLEREWAPYLHDYKLINIIDDSLIHTVIQDGAVTSRTVRRVVDLCEALMLAGADVVVETCSSIGEAAEIADRQLECPVLRIDQAMAAEAVKHYCKIGVLASLSTTLLPTVSCVERTAQKLGRAVEVTSLVAEGAFERWIAGEAEKHDDLLIEAAKTGLADCEVILLAQVSMLRVQERMKRETGKSVLASPDWCARQIREMFPEKEGVSC